MFEIDERNCYLVFREIRDSAGFIDSTRRQPHPTLVCRWITASASVTIFRLHRMHEMQTIVTDVCGVCSSAWLSRRFNLLDFAVRRSFGAAFAKLLWPLVTLYLIEN